MSHGGWWFQRPKGLESQRGAGLESSHLSGWNSRSDMFEPPQQDCCVYATMLLLPQGVKERLPFSLQVKPKNHVQESTQKIIKSGMGTSQWPCCPEAVSTSALNLKRSKGHMVAAIWLASSQGMIWQKTHPVCSFDSPFSKSYERGSVPMVEHLADQETKLVGLRRCHEGHREKLSLIYPSGLIHESADLCK